MLGRVLMMVEEGKPAHPMDVGLFGSAAVMTAAELADDRAVQPRLGLTRQQAQQHGSLASCGPPDPRLPEEEPCRVLPAHKPLVNYPVG